MFSRAKARSDDRYRLLDVIGEGGMGVVWRAFDTKLDTHVAVKTLADSFDADAFQRFQDECKKLAGLPHHPNIIRIMDVGEIEQDGRQKPYFVMPLLEGVTLAQLLQRKSIGQPRLQAILSGRTALAEFLSNSDERLPARRIVEIICEVCKGLQIAHQNGIIHRDIKPSNIFVLSDFSVQIIDFGVARRTNANSGTTGWKGTLPYMSPEQVQFKPLTTASDIFSLGVVCYEALTGDRPFHGNSNSELAEAIVSHNPKAPHEVAPVTIAISQAVFKSLAKQSDNRHLTASEFGEQLNRALGLGDAELYPLPRPRLALAADYHAKGNDEAALKVLESLHVEGISHPEISELRQRVDSSLRRKRIEEGNASGRSLIEVREYDQAARELSRVLAEDPSNPTALALLKDIDTRRTDDDVEELFRQTRRHMDSFEFEFARRSLERVRKRRPKEPRLSQFSAELERVEEEYQELQKERQRLFDAARSAFERRDISSARSSVQRLTALDAQHPDVPNPKTAELRNIRAQVEAEQQAIDSALSDVNRLIDANHLGEALEICQAQLARYTANEHFLHLQFRIEELQREALAQAIRETEALLRAEPDVLRQEKLLEARVQEFPTESHFRQTLERVRKLRAAVEEIAARAHVYESDKAFQEAQQEWQKLRTIYPRYPNLDSEVERLGARRSEQEKRLRKEKLAQQIHRQIDHREYTAALEALASASGEFQGDRELAALEAMAKAGLETIEEAQRLLRRGAELCASGEFGEGLAALRRAHHLDPATPAMPAGLIDGLLQHADAVETEDPSTAETSLREALEIDPDHAAAQHRLDLLLERRHEDLTSIAIAASLKLESEGDVSAALAVIDRAARELGADRRLLDRKENIQKKLGDKPAVAAATAPSPETAVQGDSNPPDREAETWVERPETAVLSSPDSLVVSPPETQQHETVPPPAAPEKRRNSCRSGRGRRSPRPCLS